MKLVNMGIVLSSVMVAQVASAEGANSKEKGYPVSIRVTRSDPSQGDKGQRIQVTVKIDDAWCILANPVGIDHLEYGRMKVTVNPSDRVKATITYPKAEIVRDKILGDYGVYKESVKIDISTPDEINKPISISVYVYPFNYVTGVCTHRARTITVRFGDE